MLGAGWSRESQMRSLLPLVYPTVGLSKFLYMAVSGFQKKKKKTSLSMQVLVKSLPVSHMLQTHWSLEAITATISIV